MYFWWGIRWCHLFGRNCGNRGVVSDLWISGVFWGPWKWSKIRARPVILDILAPKSAPTLKLLLFTWKNTFYTLFSLVSEAEGIKPYFPWFQNSKNVRPGWIMVWWCLMTSRISKFSKFTKFLGSYKKIQNRPKTGKTRPPKVKNYCFLTEIQLWPPYDVINGQKLRISLHLSNIYPKLNMTCFERKLHFDRVKC